MTAADPATPESVHNERGMTTHGPDQLPALLAAVADGDQKARERLIAFVYPELHRLAAHYLRLERPDHTLQTTALVHEADLRLFGGHAGIAWQNQSHFFAVAARQMSRP